MDLQPRPVLVHKTQIVEWITLAEASRRAGVTQLIIALQASDRASKDTWQDNSDDLRKALAEARQFASCFLHTAEKTYSHETVEIESSTFTTTTFTTTTLTVPPSPPPYPPPGAARPFTATSVQAGKHATGLKLSHET